jgi:hypothetical protein
MGRKSTQFFCNCAAGRKAELQEWDQAQPFLPMKKNSMSKLSVDTVKSLVDILISPLWGRIGARSVQYTSPYQTRIRIKCGQCEEPAVYKDNVDHPQRPNRTFMSVSGLSVVRLALMEGTTKSSKSERPRDKSERGRELLSSEYIPPRKLTTA